MNALGPGGLGGTYGGNPVACAAAHAAISVIEEEKLCERSAEIGTRMVERLEAIQAREDVAPIGNVRGLGAMVAFETVDRKGSNTPNPEAALAVVAKARELGLIILSCGYWGNTVRLLAPLTIPMEHLEEGLDILEQSLEQCRVEIAA